MSAYWGKDAKSRRHFAVKARVVETPNNTLYYITGRQLNLLFFGTLFPARMKFDADKEYVFYKHDVQEL